MYNKDTGTVCCDVLVFHDITRLAAMQKELIPAGIFQIAFHLIVPDTSDRLTFPH